MEKEKEKEEITDEVTPEKQPTAVIPDKDKGFNQKDVNKIVKERLAREKEASLLAVANVTADKDSLTATVESYEGIIKDIIDVKKKDVPSDYLDLLDKLTLSEQYAFLVKQEKTLADKKQIPVTPTANATVEQDEKNKKLRIF